MLNWIWAALFFAAFATAVVAATIGGKPDVLGAVVTALFDSSKTGFEISLGLTGIMTLWLGLMKIAEKGGVTELIAGVVVAHTGKVGATTFARSMLPHPTRSEVLSEAFAAALGRPINSL